MVGAAKRRQFKESVGEACGMSGFPANASDGSGTTWTTGDNVRESLWGQITPATRGVPKTSIDASPAPANGRSDHTSGAALVRQAI